MFVDSRIKDVRVVELEENAENSLVKGNSLVVGISLAVGNSLAPNSENWFLSVTFSYKTCSYSFYKC